jgi:Fe-S cluster assembly protein SufD
MTSPAPGTDLSRSAFERFEAAVPSSHVAWLRSLRLTAMTRFEELGFPTTRHEEWKYTNVAPIARTPFQHATALAGPNLGPEALGQHRPAGRLGSSELVFVNGRFAPELSSLPATGGLRVVGLRQALAREADRLEPHLARAAGVSGSAFAALNSAFLDDGAVVEVAPDSVITDPVHIVFLSTTAQQERPVVSYPRLLVMAGRNSEATVVESYGGPEGEVYLTCAVTEVLLEAGARLDHYKVQRESASAFHVATLAVRQERDSRFSNHSVCLGGAIARNDISTVFAGEGGECELNGLFLAEGEQLMDTHTAVDHASPHCSSRELYKGVLDGRSQGVFNGKVLVREGAQKSDAQQSNKNLLLSGQALVNSTPQLLILADDVKCKHGSTTGQLDPEALFYLRSRGIGESAARRLLTHAFASEVLGRFRVPGLRDELETLLEGRLPGTGESREAIA